MWDVVKNQRKICRLLVFAEKQFCSDLHRVKFVYVDGVRGKEKKRKSVFRPDIAEELSGFKTARFYLKEE